CVRHYGRAAFGNNRFDVW
nr:immunoglobulin heavy chain junction region [Macaca mulatta]